MKWIDFEKNSIFMDIGSNIGAFSIYAAVKKVVRYIHLRHLLMQILFF